MKYLMIVVFCFSTVFCLAQAEELSVLNEFRSNQVSVKPLQAGSTIMSYNGSSESNIKGTIYLFDNWFNSSKVYFQNKEQPLVLAHGFNYNIKAERFEYKSSKDSIYSLMSPNIDKIVIQSKIFKQHIDPKSMINSFYEEVYVSESISLLKKYELSVKEGPVNHMTGKKLSPDSYITKEKYYILEEGSDHLEQTKLNKRVVNNLIDKEDQSKVKKYAKEKHLSYKEETDVRYILRYAQSI